MQALLDQLGLDNTFFVELFIFAILFFVLARIYFRPFLKLIELRHQKTTEDKATAEKLLAEANAQLNEYQRLLTEERLLAKQRYDSVLAEAKKQENQILSQAREEAKKITQEAADSVSRQRQDLKNKLEADVESLAETISEQLLSRTV